jgi:hypothetical protein
MAMQIAIDNKVPDPDKIKTTEEWNAQQFKLLGSIIKP